MKLNLCLIFAAASVAFAAAGATDSPSVDMSISTDGSMTDSMDASMDASMNPDSQSSADHSSSTSPPLPGEEERIVEATFALNSTGDCTNEAYRVSLEASIAEALGIYWSTSNISELVFIPYENQCSSATVYPAAELTAFSQEAIEAIGSSNGLDGLSDIKVTDTAADVGVSCTNVSSASSMLYLNTEDCTNESYRNALMCMIASALGMVPSNHQGSCEDTGVFVGYNPECIAYISWDGYEVLTGGEYPVWNSTVKAIVDEAVGTQSSNVTVSCS